MKSLQSSVSSVQFSSVAQSCLTFLWHRELQHVRPLCLSSTLTVYSNSCASTWWCHPTISSSIVPFSSCLQSFQTLGSFLMSQYLASWPKYWSFSFSISPSNEYSGLISFRIVWFDFLAVQEILKSLLQNHSSKLSILQGSAFFSPILSFIHSY